MRGGNAAARDRDRDPQPDEHRHGQRAEQERDRGRLGEEQPPPRHRLREHEREDVALLLARGRRGGARDRDHGEDDRSVHRHDLGAEPALDRCQVAPADEVADLLRDLDVGDGVAERRIERPDERRQRHQPERGGRHGPCAEPQLEAEDRGAHRSSPR